MIFGRSPKLPDIRSSIDVIKPKFVVEGAVSFPVNKFIPLGYSSSGGKYHVMFLFSSTISDTFSVHRNKTKYSGYCTSYLIGNSDFFVGYLFVLDPSRTVLSDSYLYVGYDSDEEMQVYPLAEDDEGVHVYTNKKCVLCVSADVDNSQFLIKDN